MKYFRYLLLIFVCQLATAQEKRVLQHEDYDLWKSITSYELSDDGNIILYEVKTTTGRGNGYSVLRYLDTQEEFLFPRATNAKISKEQDYLVFLEQPDYDSLRNQKLAKLPKEKHLQPQAKLFSLRDKVVVDSIANIKKILFPKEKMQWFILEKTKDESPKEVASEEGNKNKKTKKKEKENKKDTPLHQKEDYHLVYHFHSKKKDTLFYLNEISIPEEGEQFYFSKQKKKKDLGVYLYDIKAMKKKLIDSSYVSYKQLNSSISGKNFAYLATKDTAETDSTTYELFVFNGKEIAHAIDSTYHQLPSNWELSKFQKPYFSEDENRLYFNARPRVIFEKDTTVLEEELPEVDVWTYTDDVIQPEQEARKKQLEEEAFVFQLDLNSYQVIQLQEENLDGVYIDTKKANTYWLSYSDEAYRLSRSWEYPWVRDYYMVDSSTGEKDLLLEGQASMPILAPDEKYALYYDNQQQNWASVDLTSKEIIDLTENVEVAFFNEEHDTPSDPGSYGFGGFTKNGKALVFDEFDVWELDLSGKEAPKKLTSGREKEIIYRSLRLEEDRNLASYWKGDLLLTSFHKFNKKSGLSALQNDELKSLIPMQDMRFMGHKKAKDKNQLVYRKMDFQHYPDLFLLNENADDLQLSNVNPQQEEFLWGSVELVEWEAYDGTNLQGLLYFPENFDASRKYPMITYFYERRSDYLHQYHAPQPSASIVNISYLTSNEYLVFVPDIVYEEGYPGRSAENCILSGVEFIEQRPYVDREKLAIQGQSWGGYQVAHLITKTDKFAAAGSGAPVSNMTSAYGGIRWQSGLSRQFQYEKTQSRIGKTLWEDVDLYIENSPLFGVPNVSTPVLIMHNDQDGAVPYYQGIEFFMGLRRLNKPSWLLVYNKEAHNLMKQKNRRDLSIRMMQFFDHYLKDEPMPKWMKEGLPRKYKGKDLGYDLVE